MSGRAVTSSRRARWFTVLLELFLLAVVAVDVWGTLFWARVGGQLGTTVASVGAAVAVLLALVLAWDVREQWVRASRD